MDWEDLLLEAGIELDGRLPVRGTADLILLTPRGSWTVEVKRYARRPRPHELRALIARARSHDHPLLLLTSELSNASRQMLADARISYITHHGGMLSLGDETLALGDMAALTPAPGTPAADSEHPQLPWRGRSAFQVLRRSLQHATRPTQSTLASEAHVSQPRISQVLATLTSHDLLHSDGWFSPMQRDALLAFWLARYPGPGGVVTRWYSSLPLHEAAAAAIEAANEADAEPALSSNLAADHLAPFARPTHATLYVQKLIDLSVVQMVRTPDPNVAAIEITVPEDPTVWEPEGDPPHTNLGDPRVPLADTLQIVWDTARVGGLDAPKQMERLLERTLRTVESA